MEHTDEWPGRFPVSEDGWVRSVQCPECGQRAIGLVLYGMPAGPPPPGFVVGGCMPLGPSFGCHECGWEGEESELVPAPPFRGVGPLDMAAIRRFEPFVNAIAQGGLGSGGVAWFVGEARDHFEVARRHDRIRYTVLSWGRIIAWHDSLLGWVIPISRGEAPDPRLLEAVGPCRIMPGYESGREARDVNDRVTLIVVHALYGSGRKPYRPTPAESDSSWEHEPPERELFVATAIGDGGVRFWFGYGVSELEQPWRRLVLDSVRLARIEGQTQDLGQVLAEQIRVHPEFGSAFEVEAERFGTWHEAEARATILGARQEEVRHPWDWSHLD